MFLAGRTQARSTWWRATSGPPGARPTPRWSTPSTRRRSTPTPRPWWPKWLLDVTLNVINHGDVQGTPLAEMSVADFEAPVSGLRTNFITTRAAARRMIRQGSGVVLFFGGDGEPIKEFSLGGLQVGFTTAIESCAAELAMELGRHGIRVLSLQTGGVTETLPDEEWAKPIVEDIARRTMLGQAATWPTWATSPPSPPPTWRPRGRHEAQHQRQHDDRLRARRSRGGRRPGNSGRAAVGGCRL